jgi:hypothetical protein
MAEAITCIGVGFGWFVIFGLTATDMRRWGHVVPWQLPAVFSLLGLGVGIAGATIAFGFHP